MPTDLYNQFETDFVDTFNIYKSMHEKLDTYRGKVLQDEDVEIVNKLLFDIQDIFFNKLYPTFNFVVQRYQFCCKSLEEYELFLEEIKKGGATPTASS
jgi:hypothetical protein